MPEPALSIQRHLPAVLAPEAGPPHDAEDAERRFVCLYGNALESQGKARSDCMKCCNDGTATRRAPELICTIILPKKTTAKARPVTARSWIDRRSDITASIKPDDMRRQMAAHAAIMV